LPFSFHFWGSHLKDKGGFDQEAALHMKITVFYVVHPVGVHTAPHPGTEEQSTEVTHAHDVAASTLLGAAIEAMIGRAIIDARPILRSTSRRD
jgi:hypothetical protein